MTDYPAMNRSIYKRSLQAGSKLAKAWDEGGRGGPNSDWTLKLFADWFEELYNDVIDLLSEDELVGEIVSLILGACQDVLSQVVDHTRHVKYIVRLRMYLNPGKVWYDWPCDITGMEESDIEEESTQFKMEGV